MEKLIPVPRLQHRIMLVVVVMTVKEHAVKALQRCALRTTILHVGMLLSLC